MSTMRSGGVEGKWTALNEEREQLKEENQALKTDLQTSLDRVAILEADVDTDLLAEVETLREQVANTPLRQAQELISLSPDEEAAMDGIMTAFNIIVSDWKLHTNIGELTSAIHTIQGFVVQHMLNRLTGQWGNWWQAEDLVPRREDGVR